MALERMFQIKQTDRVTNGEVLQRAKEERLLLKVLQNRHHSRRGHTVGHNDSRRGHTVGHNEFAVNISEGGMSGQMSVGTPGLDCRAYSSSPETEQLTVVQL
jgi:hypothetical protein